MSPRQRIALAALGGAMLALATPPMDLYPAAFVGLSIFAFVLFDDDDVEAKPKRTSGMLRGWLFGVGVNVLVLRFVPATITRFTDLNIGLALLALLLLAMFHALGWMVAGWLAFQLHARRVPRFLAFGIAVWVSSFVPGVFSWTVAGGISPWTSLVQLADVVGERGVTALVAISAAFAAEACQALRSRADRKRCVQYALISIGIPAGMCVAGALRMASVEAARVSAPKIRVTLVQPATEARMRWDPNEADSILRRLTRLTVVAEQRGTDLVVWPEAAFPFVMSSTAKSDLSGSYAVLQPGVRGPVLTGLIMKTPGRDADEYNSTTLVHAGKIDPPYHKMHLLAFGEGVPLSGTFPFLRKIFARAMGMVPGDHQVAFTTGHARIAVLNCFEDTLPEASVEAASVDPNLLVNVTNDAWFVETHESELHVRLATMRAIELRRDFVRAVNLGVTSWIDATGRVHSRYDAADAGTLQTMPALLEGKTLFARLGDWSGALLLGLFSAATYLGTKRKRRAPSREDTPSSV